MAFDGRLLHGAPREMTREGGSPEGYLRVSFLVNVWLDYKPRGIEPFPEEELGNLGLSPPMGPEEERTINEGFLRRVQTTEQSGEGSASFEVINSSDVPVEVCTTFEYKFGETGTEHLLRVQVPLHMLQDVAKREDVVELRWGNSSTPRSAVAEVVAQENPLKMEDGGCDIKGNKKERSEGKRKGKDTAKSEGVQGKKSRRRTK